MIFYFVSYHIFQHTLYLSLDFVPFTCTVFLSSRSVQSQREFSSETFGEEWGWPRCQLSFLLLLLWQYLVSTSVMSRNLSRFFTLNVSKKLRCTASFGDTHGSTRIFTGSYTNCSHWSVFQLQSPTVARLENLKKGTIHVQAPVVLRRNSCQVHFNWIQFSACYCIINGEKHLEIFGRSL